MNAGIGRAAIDLVRAYCSMSKDFARNGSFALADFVSDLTETVPKFDTNADCDSIIKSHVL